MKYKIAEKFKSVQGEGVYAGTPMAFIRFVGCSVGKKICQHCDTDFDEMMPWRGGGEFTPEQLINWAYPYEHICLTGGEPFDQDLETLIETLWGDPDGTGYDYHRRMFHVETSGTIFKSFPLSYDDKLWICVSPKPGFLEKQILQADEVKVIVPGLGEITESLKTKMYSDYLQIHRKGSPEEHGRIQALRWPTPEDALRWARTGKVVFIQPRNAKHDIDHVNLGLCQDIIRENPELRLSVQLHKVLRVQ